GVKPINDQQDIIITGRATVSEDSSKSIEHGAKLTVELPDTSAIDEKEKVIARGISKVTKFPVTFGI
ncbi:unnamed protein product, partial [Rotaria sp. Silwood2]